jgi:hypothetical protein
MIFSRTAASFKPFKIFNIVNAVNNTPAHLRKTRALAIPAPLTERFNGNVPSVGELGWGEKRRFHKQPPLLIKTFDKVYSNNIKIVCQ